jgi:hypothetical protein
MGIAMTALDALLVMLTSTWLATVQGPQPWDGTWSYDKPQIIAVMPKAPRRNLAPPAEFDHPYDGNVIISAENTPETILTACGFPANDRRIILGCAIEIGKRNECNIYLVQRKWIEQSGDDYDEIIRHEIGHCNGWRH